MSAIELCLIGTAVLLILFLLQMPVAFAMALVGFIGFSIVVSPGAAGELLAKTFFNVFTDYGFTTIPLFVWMGFIALYGGIGDKLYGTADKLVGEMRGGLAMATVLACTAFGAICGSSTATTATMSSVAWPIMKARNYDPGLATASIAAAGVLGVMIPPSVVLIVYAFLVQESIGALFIATVGPGLLLAALYLLVIWYLTWRNPLLGPPGPKVSLKEKLLSIPTGSLETIAIFVLMLGGLVGGLFTPTEAAAVGAAGTLLVTIARRTMTWKGFVRSVADTTVTATFILVIVVGAKMFGHFYGITGLPWIVAEWGAGLPYPEITVWAFLVFAFLVLGCFIDPMALMLLLVPIFLPLILKLGYSPLWLGPMLTLCGGTGVLTPPVGMDVYVVSSMTGVPLNTCFKGIWPFVGIILFCIALCTVFPEIVLFLPRFFTY